MTAMPGMTFEIILCGFVGFCETLNNCSSLIKVVEGYILLEFKNIQKL